MANEKRLAGVTFVSIDGVYYDAVDEVSWTPGGWKREEMIPLSGNKGEYRSIPYAGSITIKLRDKKGLTVSDFNAMDSVPVLVEHANGKLISGHSMWCAGVEDVNVVDATFTVMFKGVLVEEAS